MGLEEDPKLKELYFQASKLIQLPCTHDVLVDKAERKNKQANKGDKPKKKEAVIGSIKKLYKPTCGVIRKTLALSNAQSGVIKTMLICLTLHAAS